MFFPHDEDEDIRVKIKFNLDTGRYHSSMADHVTHPELKRMHLRQAQESCERVQSLRAVLKLRYTERYNLIDQICRNYYFSNPEVPRCPN